MNIETRSRDDRPDTTLITPGRSDSGMSGWAVIPTIRVRDMGEALDFYQNQLGFSLNRGGPGEVNSSLSRGDARIMIEIPNDFYSTGYNASADRPWGSG